MKRALPSTGPATAGFRLVTPYTRAGRWPLAAIQPARTEWPPGRPPAWRETSSATAAHPGRQPTLPVCTMPLHDHLKLESADKVCDKPRLDR